MPQGKPSGVPCIHLNDANLCELFGKSERPDYCSNFKADPDFCGTNRDQALQLLNSLEKLTR